ncbi:hypothetical protein [Polynucleobacter sp. MWH-Adler-W8]|uniref:hypothetical protein n=1 Tax=Polynucleobacter sp. MWH-Adler-W8 TaxID=1819727 RepID=UPI000929F9EB|nr:hypothetical protein [Polynucleobacter sp. MWH-Adler-W8]OJI06014.1 hypothetical protein AOC28_00085 [Polynucleobacter sp. MWH-Adler-W8]
MPKLNVTHLVGRIQERIEQLERGDALEARDINALLSKEQQQVLKDAWTKQQALRKIHKPPKSNEEANKIGWKTIREVRLEIYKQALQEAQDGVGGGIEKLLHQSEVKAAHVFMDAFSKAKDEDKNAWSAGNIALRRNGFNRIDGQSYGYSNRRDREVKEMEDSLRERMEDDLSAEEKEQLELSREYDKAVAKRRK